MTQDICFWSIGDGECALMLQTLVDSFRGVGMTEDFHVFSDRQIEGAITHLVGPFDKRGFLFKFAFLQSEVAKLDYRYFVYVDSDCLFVHKPKPLIPLFGNSPIHFFMETPLSKATTRTEWWNCPIDKYVGMMRDCGVRNPEIFCLNSGFFMIKKEAIGLACGLAQDFLEYSLGQGYFFPDEPLWNYAMHMLCDAPEKHLQKDYFDVWCTDWEGVFSKELPGGKAWMTHDYMNGEAYTVNPAIVHVLKGKALLLERFWQRKGSK